jgi:hypothetical protein
VEIERRQRRVTLDQRLNSRKAGQQPLKLALDFEHDRRAPLGNERRIAHELQRVAETLLGVQQNGLTRERLCAEPLRGGEAAVLAGDIADQRACLVAAPAGAEIAERQARDRFDKPRLGEARPAAQRPLRAHHRLLRPVEPAQRHGAIGEKRGIRGRKRQRPVVGGERLGHAIEPQQRIAAIAERIEMIRIGGKRSVKARERLAGPAELQKRHAAAVEKLRVVRCKPKPCIIT